MRNLLIGIAAASASLVVAAPSASAQPGYHGGGYYGGGHYGDDRYGYRGDRHLAQRFHAQISRLEQRIERSAQRRMISPGEYRALRRHAINLHRRLDRFAYNGLSRGEAHDIADRIHNLRDRIRDERRDGRRYDRPYRGW